MGEIHNERKQVIEEVFKDYDVEMKGELSAEQLQMIHQDIRVGSISLPQVRESMKYVCALDYCVMSELFDVMQEMDRRYFLIQDFQWEFSMLDHTNTDTIKEEQAKWFVKSVHKEFFSKRKWESFLRHRGVPGSGVSFAEIEVLLCNIPSKRDIIEEEEEDKREMADKHKREKERKEMQERERANRKRQRGDDQRLLEEEEKRRKQEMERKLQEDQDERRLRESEKDDAERRKRQLEEEEERGKHEADERDKARQEEEERTRKEREEAERRKLEEEKRRRELEDAENYERLLREAHEKERQFSSEADQHNKRFKTSTDDKLKREAEEAEKRARLKQREWKNKRIRYALKVAIKKRDKDNLPPAVKDFKDAKLPDDDMDLAKAEQILRELGAKDGLMEAMINPHREGLDRHIEQLEKAINFINRHGFGYMLENELVEANKLLLQLKKRYKIYAEIMALDQPTVAEIKSYSKPPVLVHQVMTGVFVMLGHKEKEMKDWQNVRIWVGKTGKDGLKRRCLAYLKEPDKFVVPKDAAKTKQLLQDIDLDDVRDTSAGAATFYVWAWTMVEETELSLLRAEEDAENLKKEKDAKKKKLQELSEKQNVDTDSPDGVPASGEGTSTTPNITISTEETPDGANDGDQASSKEDPGNASVEDKKETPQKESMRIGKESGEKFTLNKSGKVKKTKQK